MVELGLGNSRMKDYYDLWFLSTEYPFVGNLLANAVRATFDRRESRSGVSLRLRRVPAPGARRSAAPSISPATAQKGKFRLVGPGAAMAHPPGEAAGAPLPEPAFTAVVAPPPIEPAPPAPTSPTHFPSTQL